MARISTCDPVSVMARNSESAVHFDGKSTPLQVPPGFDEAPDEQRIAFVQELWDRIAADPQRVPVPPEHRRILEELFAAYATDSHPGRAWSEVREELLSRLRKA